MNYRYNLDKSSKKFICPNCGKKTFTLFKDNETDIYLPKEFGRCDREYNCNYFYDPYTAGYNKEERKQDYIKPKLIKSNVIEKPKNPNAVTKLDYSIIGKYKGINNFIKYLISRFGEYVANELAERYNIGTVNLWGGSTVFWQIDSNNNLRTGKVIKFDEDGKRDKSKPAKITWMHKVLQIENFELNQCAFGTHLINSELYFDSVNIVESESTAIFMAADDLVNGVDDRIWIATGGSNGISFKNNEWLKPFKNYKILFHPDSGKYDEWITKVLLFKNSGFDCDVTDYLIRKSDNFDFRDVYEFEETELNNEILEETKEPEPIKVIPKVETIEEKETAMLSKNQALQVLKNDFDLVLCEDQSQEFIPDTIYKSPKSPKVDNVDTDSLINAIFKQNESYSETEIVKNIESYLNVNNMYSIDILSNVKRSNLLDKTKTNRYYLKNSVPF